MFRKLNNWCIPLAFDKLIAEEACCNNNLELFIEYVQKIGNKKELNHEKYMVDALYTGSYDIINYLVNNANLFSNQCWNRYLRILRRGVSDDEEMIAIFEEKSNSEE